MTILETLWACGTGPLAGCALTTSVCVLDAGGKVSAETTIANTREAMARFSKKHPGALVVMEVGMQSPWI